MRRRGSFIKIGCAITVFVLAIFVISRQDGAFIQSQRDDYKSKIAADLAVLSQKNKDIGKELYCLNAQTISILQRGYAEKVLASPIDNDDLGNPIAMCDAARPNWKNLITLRLDMIVGWLVCIVGAVVHMILFFIFYVFWFLFAASIGLVGLPNDVLANITTFMNTFTPVSSSQMDAIMYFLQTPSQNLTQPGVVSAWENLRNAANGLVVLVLIIIAFAEMLHINISTYGLKKLMPGLVVAVIASNFSLFFCKLLFDFSVVAVQFLASAGAGGFGDMASNLFPSFSSATTANPLGLLFPFANFNLATFTMNSVYAICLTLTVFVLALIYVFRRLFLIVGAIVAPLAFIAMAVPIPIIRNLFNMWWTNIIKWAFAPAYSVLFLLMGATALSLPMAQIPIVNLIIAATALLGAIAAPFKMGALGGEQLGHALGNAAKTFGGDKRFTQHSNGMVRGLSNMTGQIAGGVDAFKSLGAQGDATAEAANTNIKGNFAGNNPVGRFLANNAAMTERRKTDADKTVEEAAAAAANRVDHSAEGQAINQSAATTAIRTDREKAESEEAQAEANRRAQQDAASRIAAAEAERARTRASVSNSVIDAEKSLAKATAATAEQVALQNKRMAELNKENFDERTKEVESRNKARTEQSGPGRVAIMAAELNKVLNKENESQSALVRSQEGDRALASGVGRASASRTVESDRLKMKSDEDTKARQKTIEQEFRDGPAGRIIDADIAKAQKVQAWKDDQAKFLDSFAKNAISGATPINTYDAAGTVTASTNISLERERFDHMTEEQTAASQRGSARNRAAIRTSAAGQARQDRIATLNKEAEGWTADTNLDADRAETRTFRLAEEALRRPVGAPRTPEEQTLIDAHAHIASAKELKGGYAKVKDGTTKNFDYRVNSLRNLDGTPLDPSLTATPAPDPFGRPRDASIDVPRLGTSWQEGDLYRTRGEAADSGNKSETEAAENARRTTGPNAAEMRELETQKAAFDLDSTANQNQRGVIQAEENQQALDRNAIAVARAQAAKNRSDRLGQELTTDKKEIESAVDQVDVMGPNSEIQATEESKIEQQEHDENQKKARQVATTNATDAQEETLNRIEQIKIQTQALKDLQDVVLTRAQTVAKQNEAFALQQSEQAKIRMNDQKELGNEAAAQAETAAKGNERDSIRRIEQAKIRGNEQKTLGNIIDEQMKKEAKGLENLSIRRTKQAEIRLNREKKFGERTEAIESRRAKNNKATQTAMRQTGEAQIKINRHKAEESIIDSRTVRDATTNRTKDLQAAQIAKTKAGITTSEKTRIENQAEIDTRKNNKELFADSILAEKELESTNNSLTQTKAGMRSAFAEGKGPFSANYPPGSTPSPSQIARAIRANKVREASSAQEVFTAAQEKSETKSGGKQKGMIQSPLLQMANNQERVEMIRRITSSSDPTINRYLALSPTERADDANRTIVDEAEQMLLSLGVQSSVLESGNDALISKELGDKETALNSASIKMVEDAHTAGSELLDGMITYTGSDPDSVSYTGLAAYADDPVQTKKSLETIFSDVKDKDAVDNVSQKRVKDKLNYMTVALTEGQSAEYDPGDLVNFINGNQEQVSDRVKNNFGEGLQTLRRALAMRGEPELRKQAIEVVTNLARSSGRLTRAEAAFHQATGTAQGGIPTFHDNRPNANPPDVEITLEQALKDPGAEGTPQKVAHDEALRAMSKAMPGLIDGKIANIVFGSLTGLR